jgi:prevent-host-death family protein
MLPPPRSNLDDKYLDHILVQKEPAMKISVSDAKAQLTELVRRARAGDEVILTRHGQAVVRFVPIEQAPTRERKKALLEALRGSAGKDGPDAARSADFLYDDDGLPA